MPLFGSCEAAEHGDGLWFHQWRCASQMTRAKPLRKDIHIATRVWDFLVNINYQTQALSYGVGFGISKTVILK